MEPPKKRKFFSDNLEKGVSVGHGVALDQVLFEASVPSKQDIPVFSAALLEQQNVVNSSVGGGEVTAARRNRRKYSVDFKVSVLNGYYNDPETRYNQRKTAIKYGINRRQIQKWLAQEPSLRGQSEEPQLSIQLPHQLSAQLSQLSPHKRLKADDCCTKKDRDEYIPGALIILEPETRIKTEDEFSPGPENRLSRSEVMLPRSEDRFSKSEDRFTRSEDRFPRSEDRFPQPEDRFPRTEDRFPRTENRFPRSEDRFSRFNMRPEVQDEKDDDEEIKPINLSRGSNQPRQIEADVEDQSMLNVSIARTHPDPLSTHILDTTTGLPAREVEVSLFRMGGAGGGGPNSSWMQINTKSTNIDGRSSGFLSWENFHPGTYKMFFNTGAYFAKTNTQSFYPFVEVVFEIRDPSVHYHIPLLLNPFSYTTYRGS